MSLKRRAPKASSLAVRNVMKGNKGTNTKPELLIRSKIHQAGLRYSINARPENGWNTRADLVFRKKKVAVYIHGCFWHGCAYHFKLPKRNRSFWEEKILKNKERDIRTKRFLQKRGWKVLVFWEHQESSLCAQKIISAVRNSA